jgi:hypothetical protein
MSSDKTAVKNLQPGRVSVDLGETRQQVEGVCDRLGIPLSDFIRDAVNLHLEAELTREPRWRERALLYVLQAVEGLLRRTPKTVLPGRKIDALLRPLYEAEDDLALRVYGRLSGIGHGGSLEKTARFPDRRLFPWEWPALQVLIDTIDRDEPLYLPITGPNKGSVEHLVARPSETEQDQKKSSRKAARAKK